MQSTYLKTQDAAWVKGTNYPSPPTIYLSLHTADSSLSGINEIAFSRVMVSAFSSISTLDTIRRFSITTETTFVSSPITGNATHWGAWDNSTSGNFLGGGQILNSSGVPSSISLTIGNDATLAANTISFGYNIGVFSDYFIDAKLNWLRGTSFPSAPSNIFYGIGTNLTSSGGGVDAGIARQSISWGANVTLPNYIRIQSSAALNFGGSPSNLTLNSVAAYDLIVGGNLLWIGSFPSRSYPTGVVIDFPIGFINVEF